MTLIDELSEAKEGSRELDGAIAEFIGWENPGGFGDPDWRPDEHYPHYTTSIDAALTLIPEGWNWHIWSVDDGLSSAELSTPGRKSVFGLLRGKANPALALVIAILKAKEAR